jgi:hypothetical protein
VTTGEGSEDFFAWLQRGIVAGWVSDVVCQTHDGVPLMPEEEAA